MTKKKILIFILLALTALVLLLIALRFMPKQYNMTLEGVRYQLGAENMEYEQPAIMHINGTLQKSLTGSRTFKGTINIEGETLPVPEDQREITVQFDANGQGIISYVYFDDGRPGVYAYGAIFINDDISKVSISAFGKDTHDNREGWTAADGFMITAPARDRTEALNIANVLMKDYMLGKSLR
jgi:hypothetical protein